jgi:FkbM family methyltransferase
MIDNEFVPLFQELVRQDCYRLRSVPFAPDVVLDIGANVGVFTTYARFLFPAANIHAFEPNQRNFAHLLRHTGHLPNVSRWKVVLGTGPIWHCPVKKICRPYFDGGEQYLSEGQLGAPAGSFAEQFEFTRSDVPALSLAEIVKEHVRDGAVAVVKIDVEGAENCIFNHPPSMEALRRCDYVAMELHYGLDGTGPVYEHDKPTIRQSLLSLSNTHDCDFDEPHNLFFATRKETGLFFATRKGIEMR